MKKSEKNVKIRTGVSKKRAAASVAVFLCAALLSLTVYGTVTYDSSKDPVVAFSGMQQYVSEQLQPILDSIASLTNRVGVIELSGGGGGGESGGEGGGMSSEAAQNIISRINALEDTVSGLQEENEALRGQLNSARRDLEALIGELQSKYDSLATEVGELSDALSSLQNQFSSLRSDVTTLSRNFSQISDLSTKLETVTYKVNLLTGAEGDVPTLKKQVAELNEGYAELIERVGRLYTAVHVPYNSVIIADGADDSLVCVLRAGSAECVSPFNSPATRQGLNDLSDGTEIYDGERIPLFHNVLIPRGGDDGRGIVVTSVDGAYIMIGGDYRIVSR